MRKSSGGSFFAYSREEVACRKRQRENVPRHLLFYLSLEAPFFLMVSDQNHALSLTDIRLEGIDRSVFGTWQRIFRFLASVHHGCPVL